MKDKKMEFNKNISDINFSLKNPFSAVEYRPEFDAPDECKEYQVNLSLNIIRVNTLDNRDRYNRLCIQSIVTIKVLSK